MDRARAADPGSQEAWTAAAMRSENADAAEAADAARAAAGAETPPKRTARALWGLSFAAENLRVLKYTATASRRRRTPRRGARGKRRPPTPPRTGARAVRGGARPRAEARAAFEDAEALAASAGTGPGLIAARGDVRAPSRRRRGWARRVSGRALRLSEARTSARAKP